MSGLHRVIFSLCLLAVLPTAVFAQQPEPPGVRAIQIERYLVQGLTKSFLGYHEEAIALYQKALELSPAAPAVHAALADAFLATEDLQTAIFYATQAKDYAPENLYYHQQLVQLLKDVEDLDAATQTLESMLALFPEEISVLEELAYLQYTRAAYDEALALYQQLEDRMGIQQHISYRMLQIHHQRNDVAGMEAALRKMEAQNPENASIKRNLAELYQQNDRTDDAIAILEEALQVDSTDVEIIVPLARLYEDRQETDRAEALWARTMEVSGSPEDAFARASHLYTRASDNIDTIDLVTRLLEYAIAQDPSYTEALILFGTIMFEEHHFEEAGKLLYRAVQVNPKNPEVWLQAAAAYLRINQSKQAADIADEALLLFPGQISLLRVAAYGYMDAYQNTRAINYFKEFLSLLEKDNAHQSERSELLSALGLLYARTKAYEASDNAYAAALELAPDNAIVLNNLAYSLAERELRLDEALKYAKRAVEIENLNPSFLDTLGWVYYKQGEYKQAEQWVSKAIDAGARGAATFEHMGDIQVKLGDRSAAVTLWNKSLKLNPDNEQLLEKINNIQ
ncbi:MAG: tetratricopeptide repeat protein [Bacteroidota bacterium]